MSERALDRRQRDVHDRVVEHDHEQPERDRRERPPLPPLSPEHPAADRARCLHAHRLLRIAPRSVAAVGPAGPGANRRRGVRLALQEHAAQRVVPLSAQAFHVLAGHPRLVARSAADQRCHLVDPRPRPDPEPGESGRAERRRLARRRRPRRGMPSRSAWSCIRKPFARRAAVDAQHRDLDRQRRRARPPPGTRSPRAPRARGARASSRASGRR